MANVASLAGSGPTNLSQRADSSAQDEAALREAFRRDPTSVPAAKALASFYTGAQSWGSAQAVLEEALRHHPAQSELRTELATVLAAQRKYKEAQAALHLVTPPTAPAARVRYFRLAASIHSGLGESEAAARSMEEALQILPHDEELRLLTSAAEAEAKDWTACLRNVAPLHAAHPTPLSGILLLQAQLGTNSPYQSTLDGLHSMNLPPNQEIQLRRRTAAILAAADKHAEAEAELREALKLQDGRDEALAYDLAVEQDASGHFTDALATLESIRSNHDSAEVEDLIGDVDEHMGDRAASIQRHRDAISLAPQDERYALALGGELLKYRAYEDALSVFQQAARRFPTSARAFAGLGMSNYLLENYEESASAFLRADQLDGNSGRAIAYLASTQLEIPTGPLPAAIDAICGFATRHPADGASAAWCGALLFRKAFLSDDKAAAPDVIRRLRLATRLAPGNSVANCSLGHALEWTSQWAEARRSLEVCVRLRPDSAEDHYRLRQVYLALGLTQAAAEQADLTVKANTQENPNPIKNQFVQELAGPSDVGRVK